MKEVTITIPDNCELTKDGDTYIVREKKQLFPRSWEEFCKRYPISEEEYFISAASELTTPRDTVRWQNTKREIRYDKNLCVSKEEAEAFLALMQLRQLRMAWIGDWVPVKGSVYWGIYNHITIGADVTNFSIWNPALTFPTEKMADDFLSCFRDLCETAKILL